MPHVDADIKAESAARLRAMSRVAFGQEQRLPLMLAIMEMNGDIFTLTDLRQRLEVEYASSLQVPLSALVDQGLVRRLPKTQGSRFRYYEQVTESAGWPFALELRDKALS